MNDPRTPARRNPDEPRPEPGVEKLTNWDLADLSIMFDEIRTALPFEPKAAR